MTELERPSSVRTPGRTWTEFPEEVGEDGEGVVTVEAPDDVEVRQAEESEMFDRLEADRNAVTARHAEQLTPENTVLIRIPAETSVEEDVLVETEARSGFFPHHVVVIAEEGASATVVERNIGEGRTDAAITEVEVEENATLRYRQLNALGDMTGYSDSHATVEENATMDWIVLSTGSDLYRNTVETDLKGRNSRLDYRLGFLAADDQHMDHTAHVTHAADSTSCDIDARGVAMDAARAVYKGVQEVEEGAENTESFQDETTVLLGDETEADTTPQLRIDNHDVEATHAATTGHVDEKDLFYMKSRGLRDEQAKREIITGMFDDLTGDAAAREHIHAKIRRALT